MTCDLERKYIKRLKRALKKRGAYDSEIIRDVKEMFTNSVNSGERASDLILRLGTPEEFAAAFSPTKRALPGIPTLIAALLPSIAGAFLIAAYVIGAGKGAPPDAIGYSDATTDIFVTGKVGAEILLVAGAALILVSPVCAWIVKKISSKRKNK